MLPSETQLSTKVHVRFGCRSAKCVRRLGHLPAFMQEDEGGEAAEAQPEEEAEGAPEPNTEPNPGPNPDPSPDP